MLKRFDLCTTWKVLYCLYVENPYVFTTWKMSSSKSDDIDETYQTYFLTCPNMAKLQ